MSTPNLASIGELARWMKELSEAVEAANEAGLMGLRVVGIHFRRDGAMDVELQQVQCMSLCEGEGK